MFYSNSEFCSVSEKNQIEFGVTRKTVLHLYGITESLKSTRFYFQGQRQPLRICCPFTKPNNDNCVPSNSNEISGIVLNLQGVCVICKIHDIWTAHDLLL